MVSFQWFFRRQRAAETQQSVCNSRVVRFGDVAIAARSAGSQVVPFHRAPASRLPSTGCQLSK